jgi:large subunit ribosomal protein L23
MMRMDVQKVIRRPLITEKATKLKDASNTVCFEVDRDANKIEVRRAVEKLFGVKVLDVRVANREGKWKRMGRFLGQRKAWKKAWVRLAPDQKIEFFEGV